MKNPWTILSVAVHMGPYLSISPLEKEFAPENVLYFVDGPSHEARQGANQAYWDLGMVLQTSGSVEKFLRDYAVVAIILGTSEGLPEGNIEDRAAQAAGMVGIPVFVVEDFPGNYYHRPNARLDGLFVEDDDLRDLHISRGVALDRIYCTGNPRYDVFRTMDRAGLHAKTRAWLELGKERVVFWSGQPEG